MHMHLIIGMGIGLLHMVVSMVPSSIDTHEYSYIQMYESVAGHSPIRIPSASMRVANPQDRCHSMFQDQGLVFVNLFGGIPQDPGMSM